MDRFDVNCFCGNWPFFYVRENTVDDLLKLHNRHGIAGGLISSLEAIFYQDPYEAEVQLAKNIQGTPYRHIMILNPMLPAWKADLARCVEKLGVVGIRLMPGFHGYTLSDPVIDEVIKQVKQYDLYFMITLRMQDDRTTWMCHPAKVFMEDVADFVSRHSDVRILLNHIRLHEIDRLHELGVSWDNLYVDTSGFKDGINPIEPVIQRDFLDRHIIYGSGAPMLETYASVLQLETADIDAKRKEQIFSSEFYIHK